MTASEHAGCHRTLMAKLCRSELGDLLEAWRAYAVGADRLEVDYGAARSIKNGRAGLGMGEADDPWRT